MKSRSLVLISGRLSLMALFTVHSQHRHISTTNTASPQQQTDTQTGAVGSGTHTRTMEIHVYRGSTLKNQLTGLRSSFTHNDYIIGGSVGDLSWMMAFNHFSYRLCLISCQSFTLTRLWNSLYMYQVTQKYAIILKFSGVHTCVNTH